MDRLTRQYRESHRVGTRTCRYERNEIAVDNRGQFFDSLEICFHLDAVRAEAPANGTEKFPVSPDVFSYMRVGVL